MNPWLSLPNGATAVPAEVPRGYADLLAVCDGPLLGTLVLFDARTASGRQFLAEPVDGCAAPLSRAHWYCVGTASDEPLFVERATGAVWGFPDTGVPWWQSARFVVATSNLKQAIPVSGKAVTYYISKPKGKPA